MAPNSKTVLSTRTVTSSSPKDAGEITKEIKRDEIFARFDQPFGLEQHNFNILWLGTAHVFAVYYFYMQFISRQAPMNTIPFELLYGYIGGLGATVGAHRYWCHKTFKATLPLQCLLMIMQTMSGQYPIHKWSLDHRVHHKYADTNADPHNVNRGFWFSHIGWLFLPKHDDLKQKLKTCDMSDLERDPVVRFQSKYYWSLMAVFQFILPISIIYYVYQLPLLTCVAANYRRYAVSLQLAWCVNSFAHMYGYRPYDKNIRPTDNALVSVFTVGEGWHNYHHTFPWDYKAAELGQISISTTLINIFAWFGWAYDLKTVSQKMLKTRAKRTGDGSYAVTSKKSFEKDSNENDFAYSTPTDVTEMMKDMDKQIWGWDDPNIPDDLREATKILRPEAMM